ncbi:MAG: amino acid-binding protein [Desulfamplus sp.]|nr:amino acid-binding protein [Desulfamplus sp.]MBF0412938.1 amino acid-binding protein [Desulfamplus sp.]
MIRTEISLFLKNVPGELAKLAELMGKSGVNIDAITIQDASSYVQNLFEARGKSLKRIASSASYSSIRRDSAEFALIRMLVDKTDEAVALLKEKDYLFDTKELIAIELDNTPGKLFEVTKKFGEEGININYVYGSVSSSGGKCLFVFSPEDIELASKIFMKG